MLDLPQRRLAIFRELLECERRVEQITQTNLFSQRTGYIGPNGLWRSNRESVAQERTRLHESLASYEDSAFCKLYRQRDEPEPNLLVRIWRWLTGYEYRRGKQIEAVLARTRAASLSAAFADYEDILVGIETFDGELRQLDLQIQELATLEEEYVSLQTRLANREAEIDAKLLAILRDYFSRFEDFATLRENLPAQFRLQISTVQALRQKLALFDKNLEVLRSEIQDRQRRQNDISRVVTKWRRSSKTVIQGDKTRWPVTTPQNKSQSTERLLANSHRFGRSVYAFDDYRYYDRGLSVGDVLLLDLVLNNSAEPPSRGYVAQAIDAEYAERDVDFAAFAELSEESFETYDEAVDALAEEYADYQVVDSSFGENEEIYIGDES